VSEYKYWLVNHDADTTETGLPQRRTYLRTQWAGHSAQQYAEENILRDFCRERFGTETAYVQGVAATPNWSLHAIDQQQFVDARPIRWGGFDTETRRLLLKLGVIRGGESPVQIVLDLPAEDVDWDAPRCPHCGGVLATPNPQ